MGLDFVIKKRQACVVIANRIGLKRLSMQPFIDLLFVLALARPSQTGGCAAVMRAVPKGLDW